MRAPDDLISTASLFSASRANSVDPTKKPTGEAHVSMTPGPSFLTRRRHT